MFCQQTDHCITNFKTSGTKTFTTFLHKSVFLQAVAETALMNIFFFKHRKLKEKRHLKKQIYFNFKVSFGSKKQSVSSSVAELGKLIIFIPAIYAIIM